jgi:transcriptional regulator with XRE-family HTH domain
MLCTVRQEKDEFSHSRRPYASHPCFLNNVIKIFILSIDFMTRIAYTINRVKSERRILMMFDMEAIGANIKALRENAGLGQKHIAGYLGVDQSLISKFESGERAISSDMLDKIAVLFCCPVSIITSPDECKSSISLAFRTLGIDCEDLKDLAVINRIALNQIQMDKIAGGTMND